jgi:hypothetical protein
MTRARTPAEEEELRRRLRQLSGACAECGRGAPRSLAEDIGIGYSTLNRFITGSRPVGHEQLERIRWYVGLEWERRSAAGLLGPAD